MLIPRRETRANRGGIVWLLPKGSTPGWLRQICVLDFILWLKYQVLNSLCNPSLPVPYPRDNPTQYWFTTKSLPLFTQMYADWYVIVDGKITKIVPNDIFLNEHFNDVALAFMIMGDGYWENDKQTVYICTECFTEEEVLRSQPPWGLGQPVPLGRSCNKYFYVEI